jgi:hypothetical protein
MENNKLNLCEDEDCWCQAESLTITIPYWTAKDILDNGFSNVMALDSLYATIELNVNHVH